MFPKFILEKFKVINLLQKYFETCSNRFLFVYLLQHTLANYKA